MTKGIKHKDVSTELTSAEFQATDAHFLDSGTSFPTDPAPAEMDTFYRTDEHKWYIHNGTTWKELGAGGTPTITDVGAVVGTQQSQLSCIYGKYDYTTNDFTMGTIANVVVAAGEKVRIMWYGTITNGPHVYLKIRRGATEVASKGPGVTAFWCAIVDDDPGAGTYTYTLVMTSTALDDRMSMGGFAVITVK